MARAAKRVNAGMLAAGEVTDQTGGCGAEGADAAYYQFFRAADGPG